MLAPRRVRRLPQPLRAAARPGPEPVLGQPVLAADVRQAPDPLAGRAASPRRRLPAGADAVGGRRAQGRRRRAGVPGAAGRRGTAPTEDRIFGLLFDVFRHKRHHATELPPIKPTVAELLDQPDALTFVLPDHDPDYPMFRIDEILDARRGGPRARGADALGDGAAQPVPVGPRGHRAAAAVEDRRRRVRRRVPPAQPARCWPSSTGSASGPCRRRRAQPGRAGAAVEAVAPAVRPVPAGARARGVRDRSRRSRRWRSCVANTSAPTTTSSATRASPGRR